MMPYPFRKFDWDHEAEHNRLYRQVPPVATPTGTQFLRDDGTYQPVSGGGGGAVASVNGKTGVVVLAASDVGAATTAQGAKADTAVQPSGLSSYAPLTSPGLQGSPTAPTPATAANDASIATAAFVKAQGYAPSASPALTGSPTAPTQTAGDNSTKVATTAFVHGEIAPALSKLILDAKGDLIVASAGDTPGRLPVGSDGQTLVADSTQALGMKWAPAAGGGGVTLLSPPIPVATGMYSPTASGTSTTSNAANAAATAQGYLFSIGARPTVDTLSVINTAAGAAGAIDRFGIYTAGADGLPSTLVWDSGAIPSDSTGTKTVTPSSALVLPAGSYWAISVRPSGTGSVASYQAVSGAPQQLFATASYTAGPVQFSGTIDPVNALPATWTAPPASTGRAFIVLLLHVTAIG